MAWAPKSNYQFQDPRYKQTTTRNSENKRA